MKRCVKITIRGSVQGVGYRHFIQKHAQNLLCEGLIQNREDGSVLAFVCAPSDKLDELLDFMYLGPEKAKIDEITVEPLPEGRDFRGVFRVIGQNQ